MKCFWIFFHDYDKWKWIALPHPEAPSSYDYWIAGFWKQCKRCKKKKYSVDEVPGYIARGGPEKYLGLK